MLFFELSIVIRIRKLYHYSFNTERFWYRFQVNICLNTSCHIIPIHFSKGWLIIDFWLPKLSSWNLGTTIYFKFFNFHTHLNIDKVCTARRLGTGLFKHIHICACIHIYVYIYGYWGTLINLISPLESKQVIFRTITTCSYQFHGCDYYERGKFIYSVSGKNLLVSNSSDNLVWRFWNTQSVFIVCQFLFSTSWPSVWSIWYLQPNFMYRAAHGYFTIDLT